MSREIDVFFERRGERLLFDPWAARDAYIETLLDPTPEQIEEFCARQPRKWLSPAQRVEARKLLEMQRHRLRRFARD